MLSSRLCPTGACDAARPMRLTRTLPADLSAAAAAAAAATIVVVLPPLARTAARPRLPYALRSCCSSFLIFSSLSAQNKQGAQNSQHTTLVLLAKHLALHRKQAT